MLPLGHVAGGYLVAKGLLKASPYNFTEQQRKKILYWGMLLAFLPDVDTFYSFYKSSSFTVNPVVADHRIYLTHTPVLWLIAGLLIFFAAKKPFWKTVGLMVWLASWSHFLLDSIAYGVRWLWPLNNHLFALIEGAKNTYYVSTGFWNYWLEFLQGYRHTNTFYIEILLIIFAIFLAIKPGKKLNPYV